MTELLVTYHGTYTSKLAVEEFGWIEDCFTVTVRDDVAQWLVSGVYKGSGCGECELTARSALRKVERIAKGLTCLRFMTAKTRNREAKVEIVDIRQKDHYMDVGESY